MTSIKNLTEEQINEFRETFSFFDKNNNGVISLDELKQVVIQVTGDNASEKELRRMMKEYDTNSDKVISFEEFLRIVADHLYDKNKFEADVRGAFLRFDKDRSGFVTREELKKAMRELGEKLAEDEIDEMMREADINGDSKISLQEFVNIMNSK